MIDLAVGHLGFAAAAKPLAAVRRHVDARIGKGIEKRPVSGYRDVAVGIRQMDAELMFDRRVERGARAGKTFGRQPAVRPGRAGPEPR